MTTIPLKRSQVFDFDVAIKQGTVTDNKGAAHTIIAHGDHFIITACPDGRERCFNRDGKEFADTFAQRVRMASPSKTMVKLPPYMAFYPDSLEVIDTCNSFGSLRRKVDELNKSTSDPRQAELINTTHPMNKATLRALGYQSHYWFE